MCMCLFSLGENGNVEYFEEFPIRLVHKFEGKSSNLFLWMRSWSFIIQLKATEQYFPVILFVMWRKMVLPFEAVDNSSVTIQMNLAIEQYFLVVLFIMLCKVVLTLSLWMYL